MKTTFLYVSILLALSVGHTQDKKNYNLEEVIEVANEKGIHGLIHGADHRNKLYVLSWSNPKNFFNRYNIVMTGNTGAVWSQFKTLNRGDRVFVKGKVKLNRGQPHFFVENIELKKAYDPKVSYPAGEKEKAKPIPKTILENNSAVFYVHAIEHGSALVLEYGPSIIPMIVKNPKFTEDIFRGDYVEVSYEVQKYENPHRPPHLHLDVSTKDPLKVISSVSKLNKKRVRYRGRLVMFPKSPTINQNVFAIEVAYKDSFHAARYFTLVPKEMSGESFAKLRSFIQKAWDLHPEAVYKDRNKFIHLTLMVKVKGVANVIQPNQANPQILTSLDQLKIILNQK